MHKIFSLAARCRRDPRNRQRPHHSRHLQRQSRETLKQAPVIHPQPPRRLSGSVPRASSPPKPGQYDSKPGTAWKTIGGTVKDIREKPIPWRTTTAVK